MKMKANLFVLSLVLTLSACGSKKPADADATTPVASAAIPASTPPATPANPPPATDADQAGTTANADAAGDKAVDDAIDSNLGDHQRYRDVIDALKSGVAAGDAAKVAALVQYPISVRIAGKDAVLKNEAEFVARYKDFMTPEIVDAITATKYGDLFVNYKGVSFGNGQVWINGICKDAACKAFDVKVVTLQQGPN